MLRTKTIRCFIACAVLTAMHTDELLATGAERPNFIFLLTDDQRADTLGCMGNPIIQTPHIDQLARQGVLFEQAFVTTAICMTSRACFLTGQYAARHGIVNFRTPLTPEQLAQTYPGLLKQAGYRIGFVGKWGVGPSPKDFFDFDRAIAGWGDYFQKTEEGAPIHLTHQLGDQALEFLAGPSKENKPAKDQKPFCLSISFKAPHVQDGNPKQYLYDPAFESLYQETTIPGAQLDSPEFFAALPKFLRESESRIRWEKRFSTPEHYQTSVRGYYRLISGVDQVVGRIMRRLSELGLAQNTVVIFTSDHGVYLGERGLAGKWFPHEPSIRIPLIVADPRQPDQHGTRRGQIALGIDIAPTLLDLAGIEPIESIQGHSLQAILAGDTPTWRDSFFYEHHFQYATIPASEAVRTARWKYIRYFDTSSKADPLAEELYDLQTDPLEKNNLACLPEHQAVLEQLRNQWGKWRRKVKIGR